MTPNDIGDVVVELLVENSSLKKEIEELYSGASERILEFKYVIARGEELDKYFENKLIIDTSFIFEALEIIQVSYEKYSFSAALDELYPNGEYTKKAVAEAAITAKAEAESAFNDALEATGKSKSKLLFDAKVNKISAFEYEAEIKAEVKAEAFLHYNSEIACFIDKSNSSSKDTEYVNALNRIDQEIEKSTKDYININKLEYNNELPVIQNENGWTNSMNYIGGGMTLVIPPIPQIDVQATALAQYNRTGVSICFTC